METSGMTNSLIAVALMTTIVFIWYKPEIKVYYSAWPLYLLTKWFLVVTNTLFDIFIFSFSKATLYLQTYIHRIRLNYMIDTFSFKILKLNKWNVLNCILCLQ